MKSRVTECYLNRYFLTGRQLWVLQEDIHCVCTPFHDVNVTALLYMDRQPTHVYSIKD